MNILDFGKQTRPNDVAAPQIAKARNAVRPYDNLAGSAMLRRTAKAAASKPVGGALPGSGLLASRLKELAVDQLGRELSNFYESILRQPVPKEILALVEALDTQQRG